MIGRISQRDECNEADKKNNVDLIFAFLAETCGSAGYPKDSIIEKNSSVSIYLRSSTRGYDILFYSCEVALIK